MRYRVYIGPRGTEAISPLQRDQFLLKEFASLDEAFGWARHVNSNGRVTLVIDGDDGTNLTRPEVAAALLHPNTRPRKPFRRNLFPARPLSIICEGGEFPMKDQIKEHMDVIGSDGTKIGTVDHVMGTEIKLTKASDPGGQHHFIPLDWIDHVDSHVHLSKAARDVKAQWRAAA